MRDKFILPLLIVLSVLAFRFVPHLPNVTPLAAIALFAGVYLDRKYALILPLLAMVLSDVVLGFNQSTPFVYASFCLTGGIGILLKKNTTPLTVILASLTSSVLFFLITNFNYWLPMSLYPKTLLGQLEAYMMGLPFLRNMLFGDLIYTGLLFVGYEGVRHYVLRYRKGLYEYLYTNRR